MNAREDIEAIKQRLAALEAELADVKALLNRVDAANAVTPAEPEPTPRAGASEQAPPTAAELVPPVIATAAAGRPVESESWIRSEPRGGPAAVQAEAPPASAGPNPLREWLEPLQLWPPSGEENAEVRLAAWWATRLGALLAVIGVVFLGVYVSRNSPPWVRLAEIAAVTLGVLGLGGWLERKVPKFGAVVFGAGLALGYFCAFAAYAVPAMKVVTSPFVATAVELVAVGGIFAVAWLRNSQLVATMATALGYVTAFLALRAEPGFGAWVVLLLGVVAVGLRFARGWAAPSALALPLTWLFLAAASVAGGPGRDLGVAAVWVWSLLHFGLFMARDWVMAQRGAELTTLDRALQVTNSSLAVSVALLAALRVGGSTATQFYFGSGALMLLAAWAWRAVGVRALVAVFVCKGSGLIALGVIDGLAGHLRALVLLSQAFVMLVSARQSQQGWLKIATVIVGAVAFAFFGGEIRAGNALFLSRATALEVTFLAGAIAFVAALRRWLELGRTPIAVGSILVGATMVNVVATWQLNGWAPAAQMAGAVVLVTGAVLGRSGLVAGLAGGVGFVAAHAAMIWLGRAAAPVTTLWGNELVLLFAACAAAPALGRVADAQLRRNLRLTLLALSGATLVVVFFKALAAPVALAAGMGLAVAMVGVATSFARWPFAILVAPVMALACGLFWAKGAVVHSDWLWIAALAAWAAPLWLANSARRIQTIDTQTWRDASPPAQVAVATIVTVMALWANLRTEPAALISISAVVAAVVFGLAWRTRLSSALESSWVFWAMVLMVAAESAASAEAWFAAALGWAPAVVVAMSVKAATLRSAPPAWRPFAGGVQVFLATVLGAVVAFRVGGAAKFAALGAVAGLAFVSWRWLEVRAARNAVVALGGAGWLAAVAFAAMGRANGWNSGLAAMMGVSGVCSVLPFVLARDLAARRRQAAGWVAAGAGLFLAFETFALQSRAVAPYSTVGCGAAAVATFLAGLFARSRPHRFVGLAGLALCIPRAFVVDLDSTLHRIVAFVVLGVVLLWVGFSYHRFRHLIVEDDRGPDDATGGRNS